jgi:hypothetical protein
MKRLTLLIPALLAALSATVVTGLSAEKKMMDEMLLPKRDECLLLAKNCTDNAYMIEQRIERLRQEINKGNLLYNDNELNILRKKLDDANKALEFIYREGA